MFRQPAADVRKNVTVHMQSKTINAGSMLSSTVRPSYEVRPVHNC